MPGFVSHAPIKKKKKSNLHRGISVGARDIQDNLFTPETVEVVESRGHVGVGGVSEV